MAGKKKNHLVTAFKPHGDGLSKLFGSLEADIVDIIWKRKEASARDVFETLRDGGQRLSYGAVKTVLDRLVAKEVLDRLMSNNQYIYQARLNRDDFTNSAVREILDSLRDSFAAPLYAQFFDQLQQADPDQLDQLAQLIEDAAQRSKTKKQ